MLHASSLIDVHDTFHYSSTYNLIPHIGETQHADPEILDDLAQIFGHHDPQGHFSIISMHRHTDSAGEKVMVKSSTAPDELLCTLEDIGSVNIYPSAWTLTTEGYFPVEFQRDIVNIPKKSLLDALAVFLRGHRVEGLYGISKRSPGDTMWTEEELPDGHGTRAVPRKSEKSTGARTTEWRSVLGVGGIYTPVPHVECVEPPYGGHGGDPNKPKPK